MPAYWMVYTRQIVRGSGNSRGIRSRVKGAEDECIVALAICYLQIVGVIQLQLGANRLYADGTPANTTGSYFRSGLWLAAERLVRG